MPLNLLRLDPGPVGVESALSEIAKLRPVEELALKPKTLSFPEASVFPGGALTAWRTLFDNGGLTSGQRVLIQGAAFGLGVFAVQLAKWKGLGPFADY